MTQEYTPDTIRSNGMKYTTLPTKPGRYIDRTGDEWELTEDLTWYCNVNSGPSSMSDVEYWLPFTDAPKDDEPTPPEDKVQIIEYIQYIKAGDIVYFHDDPNGYRFMRFNGNKYLRVSLCESDVPSWLRNVLCDTALVDKSFFDHAERPKPSWPEPEGTMPRMYLGADGKRYTYLPCEVVGIAPWLYANDGGYVRRNAATLAKERPEALPLREFTAPEEEA